MPTRRSFLLGSLGATLGGLLGLAASRRRRPPDVLLIIVDDLNDWVGYLGGHPDTRTPHIDRLAGRGVAFTRAYCNAPACNPSRVSLLTGIRPSSSGVYDNRQPLRSALPDAVTLPQHFMAHGYRVVGRGKIFHGRYPDPASWHEYVAKGGNPEPPGRPLNGIPDSRHFDWGPLDVAESEMDDAKVVAWCGERLQKPGDAPLFLACGLNTPHLPWYVPRVWSERFRAEDVTLPRVRPDDLDDVPDAGRRIARPQGDHARITGAAGWRGAVAGYLASIAFTDHLLGRLLDALDASPRRDATWVVFLTDQGFHLGEKLHWRKYSLWEESTRVPLIVAGPGVAPGRCEHPVSFVDVYPTLCEVSGLPLRPELEGESLAALLADPEAPRERPALTTSGRGSHSVRSERWRYIRYRDGSEELYDHAADPLEWENLAGRPEQTAVKRRLAAWLPQHDAPEAPHQTGSEVQ